MTNSVTNIPQSTLLSIQKYIEAKYVLIPLDGKNPREGWRKSVFNLGFTLFDTINFGIALQKDDLILDIDVKKGAKGLESFVKLTEAAGLETGWEKNTYVVKTGTGGFHIYLKKPTDWNTLYKHPDYPGIEIMSWGRQIVGAESIHPDTATLYRAVFCSPINVCPAPQSILDIFKRPEHIHISPQEGDYIDDSAANQALYQDILANMPENQAGGRSNATYIAACRGRDLGLSQNLTADTIETLYNQAKNQPPLDKEEVYTIVKSAYKYAKNHAGATNPGAIFTVVDVAPKPAEELKYDITTNGKLSKTLNNCVNHILSLPELSQAFRLNLFTNNIEVSSTVPWAAQRGLSMPMVMDCDSVLLRYHLGQKVRIEYAKDVIDEAITVIATRRHYHPIQNYLQSLVWDRIPRLDTWLIKYAGAPDTGYIRDISRKTICAAIKRVMQPGCKFDYVLVLEGAQGIGKSTLCRILGRLWSGDINLDPHNKDSVAVMKGKWVIELSEMTALRWAEANALKSFLSRSTDTVRPAYARYAVDFPRQSIFIGTVNPEHIGYLNDETGNRRYWIAPLSGKVKIKEMEEVCDQIYAEAYLKYKTELLYLTGNSEETQRQEAMARLPSDPMKKNIYDWLKDNPEINEVNIVEILQYLAIPYRQATKQDMARISKALSDYGWIRLSRPETPGMVFKRPEKTTAQIIDEL